MSLSFIDALLIQGLVGTELRLLGADSRVSKDSKISKVSDLKMSSLQGDEAPRQPSPIQCIQNRQSVSQAVRLDGVEALDEQGRLWIEHSGISSARVPPHSTSMFGPALTRVPNSMWITDNLFQPNNKFSASHEEEGIHQLLFLALGNPYRTSFSFFSSFSYPPPKPYDKSSVTNPPCLASRKTWTSF